jgi:hypothetical protein
MAEPTRAVKVTVSDPDTGEVLESKVIADDYIVVCAGRRYLHYTQRMGSTHMLCIKVAKETSDA